MSAVLLSIVLVGSGLPSVTELTCNDLVLLRVILRQDMAIDVHAARAYGDDLAKERASPLELRDAQELRAIMADAAGDEYERFNAARVLAYLGDHASEDILNRTLAGGFAMTSSEVEKSSAALCLLYLQSDFPENFAFSRLANTRYPELDALIERPSQPVDPNVPYSDEQVEAIIGKYVGFGWSFEVRGPLSVIEVEQEALLDILCGIATYHDMKSIPRLPFGYINGAWEGFKSEVRAGDLIYYFISDEESWQAGRGTEGYALIRDAEVVAMIVTALS